MPTDIESYKHVMATPPDIRLRSVACCVATWMALMISPSIAWSAERTTDDARIDLVGALISLGRLDDAEQMCRYELERHPAGEFEHAKWTVEWAKVIAERSQRSVFEGPASELIDRMDPAITSACVPIDDLNTRYSDAETSEFLAAAKLSIEQRVLAASIIAASVMQPRSDWVDSLLARIARLQSDADELRGEVSRKWSLRKSRSGKNADRNHFFGADEYERLIQELFVQKVSLASLQCELFAKSSADYRAAAADAAVIAEEALLQLPESSDARQAVGVMLVQALIDSGDLTTAGHWFQRRKMEHLVETDPRWVALMIDFELAEHDVANAKRLCDTYYSSSWGNTATIGSSAVDFAMLDVLLADSQDDSKVTQWIDRMEQRGGLFARRRAESIAIAALRIARATDPETAGPSSPRSMSPTLIAAQGEDWLRRGDPSQAAVLLREAAMAAAEPKNALTYATKSAAASVAAQDPLAAIDVLRRSALRFPDDKESAAVTMQAALLAGQAVGPTDSTKQRIELLEDLLNEIAQTWPGSDEAVQANQWLCRILVGSGRREEAAKSSLELLALGRRVDLLEPTIANWFTHLMELDSGQVARELDSLGPAITEMIEPDDQLSAMLGRMAVLLLDRQSLNVTIRDRIGESDSMKFMLQLFDFRLNAPNPVKPGPATIDITGVATETLQRARWRLERDAMIDAKSQQSIGALLSGWPDPSDWQSAAAAFWKSQDSHSIELIMRLAKGGDTPDTIQRGMELLGSGEAVESKRAAIELADLAAAQMKQGSVPWYQTKLQAITWLSRIGDHEQSRKRARYVLLLQRPEDPETLQQLQRYAE